MNEPKPKLKVIYTGPPENRTIKGVSFAGSNYTIDKFVGFIGGTNSIEADKLMHLIAQFAAEEMCKICMDMMEKEYCIEDILEYIEENYSYNHLVNFTELNRKIKGGSL